MAIPITSKPNTSAPDSDYPYGNIKDNPGDGSGTPVNKMVYADFHQFFAALIDLSGIAANGLPDNATNGFQYWQALFQTIALNNSAGVLETGSSLAIKTKVINIGDWNMDTDATVTISLGGVLVSKVRDICVRIIDDGGSFVSNLDCIDGSLVRQGGLQFNNSSNTSVTLRRLTGGVFDGVAFDSTSFNRGWITVDYIE